MLSWLHPLFSTSFSEYFRNREIGYAKYCPSPKMSTKLFGIMGTQRCPQTSEYVSEDVTLLPLNMEKGTTRQGKYVAYRSWKSKETDSTLKLPCGNKEHSLLMP